MRILQVVGYKKSGKTTLINDMIQICKSYELSVTTVKNHGHGNHEINLSHKEADSLSFMKNGANESIVLGNNMIERLTKHTKSLSEIINEDLSIEPDLLLIEGFKEDKYAKIVLSSQIGERPKELVNIIYELNVYNSNERESFLKWFENEIKDIK